MRLLQFRRGSRTGVGVRTNGIVRDLTAVEPGITGTRELLAAWSDWCPRLPELAARAPQLRLGDLSLLAPLSPRRIFAVGANYASHLREMGVPAPPVPSVSLKAPTSVCGSGAEVELPESSPAVDYEGEIAAVVGGDGSEASVVALTLANDVSARDLPIAQTALAKSSPGFCPLGPELVRVDELDLGAVRFEVLVNGEPRQAGTTAEMTHGVSELVACIRQSLPLHAGDVVLTGTPAGVGVGRSPPRLLRPGDEVEVNSPQLGSLRTRFVSPTTVGPA